MNKWLILFCAFLLFAGMLIGENKSTVEKVAAKCSKGNQEACKKLADIAKNDKKLNVRMAAVERLTDQTVLAKIALEDFNVGYAAIKNLANQSALTKVAADDKDWRVRLIFKYITAFNSVPAEHRERLMKEVLPVIRVLSYPAIVSEVGDIVSIETEWNVTWQSYTSGKNLKGEIFSCTIKVQKLFEPLSHTWRTSFPDMVSTALLGFWSAEVNPAHLLRIPFEKITDQALLAEIANNDKNSNVRIAAAENLIDQTVAQAVFTEIAKNDNEDTDIRMTAVDKLIDQAVLADIVKNDKLWDINRFAVKKLTDQTLLAEVAMSKSDGGIRMAAVEKLTDQSVLADIAKKDVHCQVRETAVKKLPADHPLRRVVLASEEDARRITDQTLLADIAKSAADWRVRKAAVEKLTGQVPLANIAKNDDEWEVRKAAVEKLIDRKLLADIAKNDEDSDIRDAAERRLKTLKKK